MYQCRTRKRKSNWSNERGGSKMMVIPDGNVSRVMAELCIASVFFPSASYRFVTIEQVSSSTEHSPPSISFCCRSSEQSAISQLSPQQVLPGIVRRRNERWTIQLIGFLPVMVHCTNSVSPLLAGGWCGKAAVFHYDCWLQT